MLFCVELLVVCFLVAPVNLTELGLQLDHMSGTCRRFPDAPITLSGIHAFREKQKFFLSMTITSRKRLQNDMMVKMRRCISRDAPDTCENYQVVNVRHMCDKLSEKHHTWTPFIEHMKPTFRCPVEKRIYTVTNGTFDGTVLTHFPFYGWYWKGEVNLVDVVKNKTVMCVYLEGKMTPI